MGGDYRCDPNREASVKCADSRFGAGSWAHAPRGYLIAPATLRLTARPDDRSDRHRESPRWSGHERGALLERLRRAVPVGGAAGPVGGAATALRLSEPPRAHGPAGAAARLRGPAAVLRAALAGHPQSRHGSCGADARAFPAARVGRQGLRAPGPFAFRGPARAGGSRPRRALVPVAPLP